MLWLDFIFMADDVVSCFNIGDKVRYKNGFTGVALKVASVNCDRVEVVRSDRDGEQWFRRAYVNDLVAIDE